MTLHCDGSPEIAVKSERRSILGWPIKMFANLLPSRCDAGSLTIRLPSGQQFLSTAVAPGPEARIEIKRWRGLRRMLMGGHVGFAQAFMDGDCDCANLAKLFQWVLVNDSVLAGFGAGWSYTRLSHRRHHRLNDNTLSGSRRNIAAHYDLGNRFYEAWLDTGMNYSSALYAGVADRSLEAAQFAKLDRIIELMDLAGGERVLEIGFGWGALAERLMATPMAHVTGLTLSHNQLEYARGRLAASCPNDRSELRLQDYREVGGTYDRIVSIEMLEAVGERYWPVYFGTLRRRLAPGGNAVLQVITINPDRFAAYQREPDFIQRYIFPGGMLPTIPILKQEISAAGLALTRMETFGTCYARTLAEWRDRFLAAWPQLQELGFDERFRRMWMYYLTYCEVGFAEGELDVGLYVVRHNSLG